MHKKLLTLAAALCFSGLALAQSAAPAGSYRETCEQIVVNDEGVLSASCKRVNGRVYVSTLPQAASCKTGIDNYNGHLVCTQPGGSWSQSCEVSSFTVDKKTGRVSASCKDAQGQPVTKTVHPAGQFTNCDGQLTSRQRC